MILQQHHRQLSQIGKLFHVIDHMYRQYRKDSKYINMRNDFIEHYMLNFHNMKNKYGRVKIKPSTFITRLFYPYFKQKNPSSKLAVISRHISAVYEKQVAVETKNEFNRVVKGMNEVLKERVEKFYDNYNNVRKVE